MPENNIIFSPYHIFMTIPKFCIIPILTGKQENSQTITSEGSFGLLRTDKVN